MRQEQSQLQLVTNSDADDVCAPPGGYRVGFAAEAIIDLEQRETVLYSECLARTLLPNGRLRMPSTFIPGLEALGAIGELDRFMLELTLKELDANPLVSLGCNLSPDSLADEARWMAIIGSIAERPHLAPRLVLEITEDRPLDDITEAARRLTQVRELGCRIAIDDFGVGHALPFRLLGLDVEIDIVKIDKSFLHRGRTTPSGKDNLRRVVGFALCLAPVVVAEGIETKEHLAVMRAAGATHGQGYLFRRDAPGRWRTVDHPLGNLLARVIEPPEAADPSTASTPSINLLNRLWSLMAPTIGRGR